MFLALKAKLAAAGALILVVLTLYIKTLKFQRDRAVVVAETLKARHHVQRKQQKIKREEKIKLHSRRVEIIKEISKEKEKFKGVKNLNDSNDY